MTNSIIHGYNGTEGKVYMDCSLDMDENENHGTLKITVKDKGVGIENVEKAKEPLFTTKPELERSGMGFMFMEMFMDDLYVESKLHNGTTVCMTKKIKNNRK